MAVIVMTSSFTVEAGFSGERRGPRPTTQPPTQPYFVCCYALKLFLFLFRVSSFRILVLFICFLILFCQVFLISDIFRYIYIYIIYMINPDNFKAP